MENGTDLLELIVPHAGTRNRTFGDLINHLHQLSCNLRYEYRREAIRISRRQDEIAEANRWIEDSRNRQKGLSATITAIDTLLGILNKASQQNLSESNDMLPPPGNGRAASDMSAGNPDGPTADGLTAPVAAPVADL